MKRIQELLIVVTCALVSSVALAQPAPEAPPAPPPSAPSEPSFATGTEAGTGEVGLYWGLFFPSSKHELYDPRGSYHELERVTPELGLRGSYYPLSILGVELEAGLMPSQTRDTSAGLNVYTLRAHAMLLAPTKGVVPFVLVGGGLLGEASEPTVLGSDLDGEFHFGVGAKAYATPDVALRLDIRDNISNGRGKDETAMHWEGLLGFSVVIGREKPLPPAPPPPPPDSDGDGFDDSADQCKDKPGVAPDGCPLPDADGDGIPDAADACPKNAGLASANDPSKNGCPADTDADGVPDANDKCPNEAGDGADGCVADGDGDGIRDRDDKCADKPETKNGFDDTDGCPDELPEAVKAFTGVIEGIVFDANKATIKAASFKKLDDAVKVLNDFPTLRMEVSGHSDDSGNADKNLELSKERAEAVKAYFVSKGVAAERVEARGAGSAEPIGDNKTKEGRAKNRRIEFKVLQ